MSEPQIRLLDRYVDAFHRYDVDELTSLLREDASFCMPPYEMWLQGPASVRAWLLGPGSGCRGSRLVPVEACGSPAFGQYRCTAEGGYSAWALIVLELAGDRIAGWN
jgi:RNA polymerase sigma-70 factor (ECF subfamily)